MPDYREFPCSECEGEGCELCDFTGTESVEDISDKLAWVAGPEADDA